MSELKDTLTFMQSQMFKDLTKSNQKEIRKNALNIIKNKFRAFTNDVAHDLAKEIANDFPNKVSFTFTFDCENIEWNYEIVGATVQQPAAPVPDNVEPITVEPQTPAEKGFLLTFANGPTISEATAHDTFIAALKYIGLNRIPNLGITFDNINLVEVVEKDATLQEQVDGVYVYTKVNRDKMMEILKKISAKYYLGVTFDKPKSTNLFGEPEWDKPIKSAREVVRTVFNILKENDRLDDLLPYLRKLSSKNNRALIADNVFRIPSCMFKGTKKDLERRNQQGARWFEDEYVISGITYYLSNQWRDENYQGNPDGLQFNEFKKMLNHIFPGTFEITKTTTGYTIKTKL